MWKKISNTPTAKIASTRYVFLHASLEQHSINSAWERMMVHNIFSRATCAIRRMRMILLFGEDICAPNSYSLFPPLILKMHYLS